MLHSETVEPTSRVQENDATQCRLVKAFYVALRVQVPTEGSLGNMRWSFYAL